MKHPDDISLDQKLELLKYLKSFVSENKNSLFNRIIKDRTRYITAVLEDIYQPHNASAVLRSCDCFGIQDVHIIENENEYTINPDVALGSSKWLTLHRYNNLENNTLDCLSKLKAKGYRLVATTPQESGQSLHDLPLNDKVALLFGTELRGLSEIALSNADEFLHIPMYGFTESLNISVSAALIMFNLTEKMRSEEIDWQLTDTELVDVQIDWARSVVKDAPLIEREFFSRFN